MSFDDYRVLRLSAETIDKKKYNLSIDVKKDKASFAKVYHYSVIHDSLERRHLISLLPMNGIMDGKNGEKYITSLIQVTFYYGAESNRIRENLYEHGFLFNEKKFVQYKRSASSAREGKCFFIEETYQKKMDDWTRAGILKTKGDSVSYASYAALTLSSIENTIRIPLTSILLVPDVHSQFIEKAVGVSIVKRDDNSLTLDSKEQEVCIDNPIWDGEGLMDESLFRNDYEDKSMLLLRNKFFKCCAFKTRLKEYLKDETLVDLRQRGFITFAKKVTDISLVFTPSSLKYLKVCEPTLNKEAMPGNSSLRDIYESYRDMAFDKDIFDGFTQWIQNSDNEFGIVKTEEESPFFDGTMVRTSYQMLNSLALSSTDVSELYQPAMEYRNLVARDIDAFFFHLKRRRKAHKAEKTYVSSYRFLLFKEMTEYNIDFFETAFAKQIRRDTTDRIRENMKNGKILIDGKYCYLCGNGYELLKYIKGKLSVKLIDGVFVLKENEESILGRNTIATKGFLPDEKLTCFRYPHVTMGNVYVVANAGEEVQSKLNRYFPFTNEIVHVNAIRENIQHRLNGCDYDSDEMLITRDPILRKVASRYSDTLLVPVYVEGNMEAWEKVDSAAQADQAIFHNNIGKIINLSADLNCKFWDELHKEKNQQLTPRLKELYYDICKLAVLSGKEIDKAKRQFPIDAKEIIKEMEQKYTHQNRKGEIVQGPVIPTYRKGNPIEPLFCPMEFVTNYMESHCETKTEATRILSLRDVFMPSVTKYYKSIPKPIQHQVERAEQMAEEIAVRMLDKAKLESYDMESLVESNMEKGFLLELYSEAMQRILSKEDVLSALALRIDQMMEEVFETTTNRKYILQKYEKKQMEYYKKNGIKNPLEQAKKDAKSYFIMESNKAWILLYYLWQRKELFSEEFFPPKRRNLGLEIVDEEYETYQVYGHSMAPMVEEDNDFYSKEELYYDSWYE